jgi:hypothetical protein
MASVVRNQGTTPLEGIQTSRMFIGRRVLLGQSDPEADSAFSLHTPTTSSNPPFCPGCRARARVHHAITVIAAGHARIPSFMRVPR